MSIKSTSTGIKPFVRTPLTWLMYLAMATFCYMEVAPGSIVPYLHSELHLDYTLDSLHQSALAVGTVVAGLSGNFLSHHFHRRTILWAGLVGMLAGIVLLAVAHLVELTLLSFFVIGLCGTFTLIFGQSVLADSYGDQRATAIVEANVACSAASMLAPACLGVFVAIGLGWRAMLLIPFIAVALLASFWFKLPIPDAASRVIRKMTNGEHGEAAQLHTRRSSKTFRSLPLTYILYWLAMVLMVAIEWGIVFWGSGYLINVVGLPRDLATLLMSLFFAAAIIGRIVGSRLTRYFSAERLLPFMLIVGLIGFLLFWLGPIAWINVLGLFVAGLGIENLFPLSFSASANQLPDRIDFASSFGALGTGVAITIAPFVLGRLGDAVGLRLALLCLLALFIISFVLLVVGYRLVARRVHANDLIADAIAAADRPVSAAHGEL